METFRKQVDGLKDGDGHFEVVRSGPDFRLQYHLDSPYSRVFDFADSLDEIAERVFGSHYTRSAVEAGVTPMALFAVHTWESALTAKDGETKMKLILGGVRTF